MDTIPHDACLFNKQHFIVINNNTRYWIIVVGWNKYYFDFKTYKIWYFSWHIPVEISDLTCFKIKVVLIHPTMFELLVLLFIIKLYAHYNTLKHFIGMKNTRNNFTYLMTSRINLYWISEKFYKWVSMDCRPLLRNFAQFPVKIFQ